MKNPTEHQEGVALARWMRARGILFVHVPNEGARGKVHGRRLRDAGVERGCPDYLVFTPSPQKPEARGVAIELKRRPPARASVSPSQRAWVERLEACGWIARVCRGAQEAVALLRSLGFDDDPASVTAVTTATTSSGDTQTAPQPGLTVAAPLLSPVTTVSNRGVGIGCRGAREGLIGDGRDRR